MARDGRVHRTARVHRQPVDGREGRACRDQGRLAGAPVRQVDRDAGDQAEGGAVRRPVALSELDVEREDVQHVLGALANGRLVTLSQDRVEVAHEALLREWPRLRDWIAEDAEGRRLHHHLAVAAREWEAGGRDVAELYRGARLAAALEWSGQHQNELIAAQPRGRGRRVE